MAYSGSCLDSNAIRAVNPTGDIQIRGRTITKANVADLAVPGVSETLTPSIELFSGRVST